MRAWPNLPAAQQQILIRTHGLANMQTVLSHVIEREALEARKWHQEVLSRNRAIGPLAETRYWLGVVKVTVSTTLTGIDAASRLYEAGGWKSYFKQELTLPGEKSLAKAAASRVIEDDQARRVLDAIPTSPTLPSVAGAAASSWLNRGDLRLKDQLEGHLTGQAHALDQQFFHASRLRGLLETFPHAPEGMTPKPMAQPGPSITGFYTSADRPLTDLSALASTIDKNIKPIGDSPRSALIVAQDPFRTSLLQSELSKYRIQSRVMPPGTDPQITAKQWGADVIVGIKPSDQLIMDQRKPPPLSPPGGGSGVPLALVLSPPYPQPSPPSGPGASHSSRPRPKGSPVGSVQRRSRKLLWTKATGPF
jgi:hypothetical protein